MLNYNLCEREKNQIKDTEKVRKGDRIKKITEEGWRRAEKTES